VDVYGKLENLQKKLLWPDFLEVYDNGWFVNGNTMLGTVRCL
jgi:hypothetical protein